MPTHEEGIEVSAPKLDWKDVWKIGYLIQRMMESGGYDLLMTQKDWSEMNEDEKNIYYIGQKFSEIGFILQRQQRFNPERDLENPLK